jgi:hypothetical protein
MLIHNATFSDISLVGKGRHFFSVKYLMGLAQSLAVSIYTVDIVTAGLWANTVKYFMLLCGVPPTQKHVVMMNE